MQEERFQWVIRDWFICDERFRKSMIELGPIEEICREMYKLANEDHTHHITPDEIRVYRNNWWIRSRCDRKTSSTRIRRRTCHSQIATHDEFDRKNSFGRVIFSFLKPGEDLRMDIKILEDLYQVTIERGNLSNRHHQVIQQRIMVDLGLLKSGKSGTAEHDRSGKPEKTSWDKLQKVDPHREEPLFGGNAHSARYGELIHDRTGKPVSVNPQEGGKFRKFRHGQWRSRICEQSQRPSAKQTEKNVECCRVRWRAFNNMENVYGCDDECGDIHGERISQLFKVLSRILKISRWNRCSMSQHNWLVTRKKSMGWTKFCMERILGHVCP